MSYAISSGSVEDKNGTTPGYYENTFYPVYTLYESPFFVVAEIWWLSAQ